LELYENIHTEFIPTLTDLIIGIVACLTISFWL